MSITDLDVQEGWVRMYHPDLGGEQGHIPTSVVTKESFEDNHSERGWTLVIDTTETKNIDGVVFVTKPSAAKPAPAPVGGKGGDA